mmetsp:Transcript_18544/g.48416  ORF Transcript_18544/g.48416 Transcript_18544/m.48416 type:complete len:337 (-) Transcript_18544:65-1075(-)
MTFLPAFLSRLLFSRDAGGVRLSDLPPSSGCKALPSGDPRASFGASSLIYNGEAASFFALRASCSCVVGALPANCVSSEIWSSGDRGGTTNGSVISKRFFRAAKTVFTFGSFELAPPRIVVTTIPDRRGSQPKDRAAAPSNSLTASTTMSTFFFSSVSVWSLFSNNPDKPSTSSASSSTEFSDVHRSLKDSRDFRAGTKEAHSSLNTLTKFVDPPALPTKTARTMSYSSRNRWTQCAMNVDLPEPDGATTATGRSAPASFDLRLSYKSSRGSKTPPALSRMAASPSMMAGAAWPCSVEAPLPMAFWMGSASLGEGCPPLTRGAARATPTWGGRGVR